jgi:hypothetical protein
VASAEEQPAAPALRGRLLLDALQADLAAIARAGRLAGSRPAPFSQAVGGSQVALLLDRVAAAARALGDLGSRGAPDPALPAHIDAMAGDLLAAHGAVAVLAPGRGDEVLAVAAALLDARRQAAAPARP